MGQVGMIHMHVFKYPMIERATGRRAEEGWSGFLLFYKLFCFSLFGRGIPVSRLVFIYNMFLIFLGLEHLSFYYSSLPVQGLAALAFLVSHLDPGEGRERTGEVGGGAERRVGLVSGTVCMCTNVAGAVGEAEDCFDKSYHTSLATPAEGDRQRGRQTFTKMNRIIPLPPHLVSNSSTVTRSEAAFRPRYPPVHHPPAQARMISYCHRTKARVGPYGNRSIEDADKLRHRVCNPLRCVQLLRVTEPPVGGGGRRSNRGGP